MTNDDQPPPEPEIPLAAAVARLMASIYPPDENDLPPDFWDDFKENLKNGSES